ncbi:TRAP transporter large permease [Desulfitibacter alkalitolerans]|uniref:TRAP transporter large permease n=1 Tax=Desulfitibacter alkalitolerans TaxID=264641 RepID=UPI000480AD4C|nr:TRAP transporter large permease subunit [Desulfitibacter alkalitolerans]
MALAVFFATLFLFLLLGVPIAFTMVLCAVTLMVYMDIFNAQIIAQNMIFGANNFPLMAIPFFMLAGEIMGYGGLSKRIVAFANLIFGRFKGGLGYVVVFASILFAGLSGSAVADTAALGSILVPLMAAEGYRRSTATGLVCSAGIIAPIIPPSIPMILFGVTSGVSITRLFMAGVVPGLIMGIVLMFVWFLVTRRGEFPVGKVYDRKQSINIIKESIWALIMPFIIIGGIRFGIFTPTEAGAIAVAYALFVSLFIYKDINIWNLKEIFVSAAKTTAVVMFVASGAIAVAWLLTVAQIPMQLASMFSGILDRPLLLLLMINVLLMAVGMVMDATPAILIFTPVLLPIVVQAGIDPVFFGVIMVLNLCIGLITPPVGTVLYVGCGVGRVTLEDLVKAMWPFLLAQIFVLVLLILFPNLVLVPMEWLMK